LFLPNVVIKRTREYDKKWYISNPLVFPNDPTAPGGEARLRIGLDREKSTILVMNATLLRFLVILDPLFLSNYSSDAKDENRCKTNRERIGSPYPRRHDKKYVPYHRQRSSRCACSFVVHGSHVCLSLCVAPRGSLLSSQHTSPSKR
jgi:hypothetical protein